MKTQEIFEQYLNLIWSSFMSDVEVLSIWWMWAAIFPAIGYILFMWVKWILLTMPLWIPIKIIRMLFEKNPSYYQSVKDYRKQAEDARLTFFDKNGKK